MTDMFRMLVGLSIRALIWSNYSAGPSNVISLDIVSYRDNAKDRTYCEVTASLEGYVSPDRIEIDTQENVDGGRTP